MKTVLILHGIGGHAGIHWQQWLHDELEKQGYKVLMPELPNPGHPDRKTWLNVCTEELSDINLGELTIVGHSLSVTTALDFIEQSSGKIGALMSVAGFAEDYGAELNSYFLSEKTINFETVKNKLKWAEVVYGDNDPYVTQSALKQVADGLNAQPTIIPDGGHLNTETGFTKFPLLVDILKSKNQDS
jgi:predicted alpha/beta hydrolase family esterase